MQQGVIDEDLVRRTLEKAGLEARFHYAWLSVRQGRWQAATENKFYAGQRREKWNIG
jgi:hypothetical protein